ncbi:hypothetical protein BJX61DRAFT_233298 [Aspergillus egyptiacus]|nr:hypothetical protein BJX61DRAFT_233298 [Aspergillus egyptiacus]
MSSNVGLSTPRGSGTSGYVQRNSAFLKPRTTGSGAPYPPPNRDRDSENGGGFKQRQPDKAILEHEARRKIEVDVLEERERLEEENEAIEEGKKSGEVLSEEEIERRCEELRGRLVGELERAREAGRDAPGKEGKRGFKAHQVHELAEAKIRESERLRRALGIRDENASDRGTERVGEVERRRERERERERERRDE